ncbi:unnamed protein product, partial [Adineta steineri]
MTHLSLSSIASPCASWANCNLVGGGGICLASGGGSADYKCIGCSYGTDVTNGVCPASPCNGWTNCNSAGGGGTCQASGGGSADYKCTRCITGDNVMNGACA